MLGRVHGMDIDLHVDGRLAPGGDRARELAILRISHEALHNALRHAGANHVTVRVIAAVDGAPRTVEVSDDGVGFDPAGPELRSRHLGLTSMEERARELGGRLEIRSAPGAGTTVRLEVPSRG